MLEVSVIPDRRAHSSRINSFILAPQSRQIRWIYYSEEGVHCEMAAIPMSRTISMTAKLEQRRRPSYKSLFFWIKGYLN